MGRHARRFATGWAKASMVRRVSGRVPTGDVRTRRPWGFDGDGARLRLASEAHRIRLAYLFDPLLAVHTSLVDPLPHQITAVYAEMLTRQPLRFLLADDPGAGETIMACASGELHLAAHATIGAWPKGGEPWHRRRRDPGREPYWRQVLARWRRSGLSVRAFCRGEGVNEAAVLLVAAEARTGRPRDTGLRPGPRRHRAGQPARDPRHRDRPGQRPVSPRRAGVRPPHPRDARRPPGSQGVLMLSLPPTVRIFLAAQPTDLRKSFDSFGRPGPRRAPGRSPLGGHLRLPQQGRRPDQAPGLGGGRLRHLVQEASVETTPIPVALQDPADTPIIALDGLLRLAVWIHAHRPVVQGGQPCHELPQSLLPPAHVRRRAIEARPTLESPDRRAASEDAGHPQRHRGPSARCTSRRRGGA